jgi:hypothetical protein
MDRHTPERGAVPKTSICWAVRCGKPLSGQQCDTLLSVLSTRDLSNEILEHRSD